MDLTYTAESAMLARQADSEKHETTTEKLLLQVKYFNQGLLLHEELHEVLLDILTK